MAKFTSILLLATATLASFSAAAPIAATTTVTKFVTVTATAPVATPTAAATEAEEPPVSVSDIYASSTKYQGKATWFTDSYGSCGETWDGYSEPIVALSAQMMGVQAWGHPACNKSVHITLRDDPSKPFPWVSDLTHGHCALRK
ncbi:hypothetical protein BG005_004823 [Podila minutissima]|nr:hypothetical protein BG005_004823 [Podila minutissima]